MITAQELTQWRPFAPWSSDLMVEQDYLLSQCVAALFEDSFLKGQVAMRGGTVLHKGHLAPASRYSEDIDLVLTGERPASHIKNAIARVLAPILGQPSDSAYGPTSAEAALAQLKIEVNINERKSFFDLVPIDIAVPDGRGGARMVSVQSYDLHEMLGTKLRALLQREHGRDLFDLWWSWEASRNTSRPVEPARVGAAFRFYMRQEGSTFKAADVRRELDLRMGSRKFLSDMVGYLPLNRTYAPQQAHKDFCKVFLPHLDAA